MNRNRMLILGTVALILSLFVTFLIYRNVQSRLRPPEPSTQIVVALEKLPLGARIAESNVHLASWPKSLALQGAFSDPKEIIGRGVIVSMQPNEPILDSKLAPKEGGGGLTSVIPEGMRALSVKVNDVIGVAGFVLPGTRVDVIMTGSPKNNEEVASKAILENVQVLAAGQNVEQDSNGKPQNVQVVTLLVSPEQAQELALAQVDGTIQLALRNPLDAEQKNPPAVVRSSLFTKGEKVAPAAPKRVASSKPKAEPKPVAQPPVVTPPAPAPDRTVAIELFQGRNKEVVTFSEKQ
jgi:pilus assembly protein CpaB